MPTKEFHLGDILSITTGYLVSPDHIDGIYEILDFLTGDELMSHQLPLAVTAVESALFEQLPFLRNIVIEKGFKFEAPEEVTWWLEDLTQTYGEYHTVSAVPQLWGAHDSMKDFLEVRAKGRKQ